MLDIAACYREPMDRTIMTRQNAQHTTQEIQRYFLARHVHCCDVGQQTIFLDLRRDDYLALNAAQRAVLTNFIHGWAREDEPCSGAPASSKLLQSLLRRDLLTTDPRCGRFAIAPEVEPAKKELAPDDTNQPNAGIPASYIPTFLWAVARASFFRRMRSLEATVDAVRNRKARAVLAPSNQDSHQEHALVAVFERLRPFVFSAKDQCLFDSLALIEFLAMFDVFPTWVIGVHTHPFAAHSWVQSGGIVFNGPIGFVRKYTPILAV
jgi:hypothetical protein